MGALDFDVEIVIECSLTTLAELQIDDMSYTILESSYDAQIVPDLSDSVSDLMGISTFCGNRVY